MEIEYIDYLDNEQGLNLIKPLWERLNECTGIHSQHFCRYYSGRTFEPRKKYFIETSKLGALHIDLAKDLETRELIGYCVSTISEDNRGVVESIYIEPNYRQHGIGGNLMGRALCWMDSLSVKSKTLSVAVGNEEVFRFYSHYNFYPKSIKLEQTEN